MLSWLGAAPDWAKAARDTARKHIAINLLIIFLMDSPRFSVLTFSWREPPHRGDVLASTKLQVRPRASCIETHVTFLFLRTLE